MCETVSYLAPVRAAGSDQRCEECDDHTADTDHDAFLDLGIDALGQIAEGKDRQHDQRTDPPVEPEDQVHSCACTRNIAERKEETGQEQRNAAEPRGNAAVIMPDGVQDRKSGHNGDPIRRERKCNTHKDDRDEEPEHLVPIVRAHHRGRGNIAGSDHNTGQDDARTYFFDQFPKCKLFDRSRIETKSVFDRLCHIVHLKCHNTSPLRYLSKIGCLLSPFHDHSWGASLYAFPFSRKECFRIRRLILCNL